MTHKEILPECAANVAELKTIQKMLGEDMKEIKSEVKELTAVISKATDEISSLARAVQSPSEECPLYKAYKEDQKKTLENAFNGKVKPNWFLEIMKTNIAKSIVALVVLFAIAVATTYLGGK